MNYGGIDPSLTGFAIVVIDPDAKVLAHRTISTPSELPQMHRIHLLRRATDKVFKVHVPRRVCMEDVAYGGPRMGNSARMSGVIEYNIFWRHGIHYKLLPPTSLKKWATDNGKASKEEMLAGAREVWPECPNDNEADAFLMAMWIREQS